MVTVPAWLRDAGTTAAYLLLGVVVTAVSALALLLPSQSLQGLVYELFYLQVGPSEATETAILTHVIAVSVVAVTIAMAAGEIISDRGVNRRPLATAIAALVGSLAVFLVIALAHLAAFLTALVVLTVTLIAIPVALRYRLRVRSGAVPAIVGAIPVVVVLLLLTGFGLGWGWGYVVVAQEVPAPDGGAATDFAEVPEIRADLFAPSNCETDPKGDQRCHLLLRGYEHETRAARFMARHGARCPYQNDGAARSGGSFVASHDGTYYRVSCSPHGD